MHLRHNMFKMFSREHTEHTCSLSFMFYVFVQPFCPFASSTLAPWRCQAQVAGAAIWAALEPAMYILRKGAFARRTGAIASHVASFRSMRHIGFLRCGGVESFCNTDPTQHPIVALGTVVQRPKGCNCYVHGGPNGLLDGH